MDKQEITVKRVAYGRADTPPADREYREVGQPMAPVGNRQDWVDFATGHEIESVTFIEIDGETSTQKIKEA